MGGLTIGFVSVDLAVFVYLLGRGIFTMVAAW